LVHIDFQRINLDREIEVEVAVNPSEAVARGVREGGVQEHIQRYVRVWCKPMDIPREFKVDLSDLGINDSFHVRDLKLPEGVEVLDEPEATLFTILPPTKEEEPVPAAVAEEAEEEPELVGEKKEKEEAEEEK
jgi:large subunit ribosomal protein L25